MLMTPRMFAGGAAEFCRYCAGLPEPL